MKKQNKKKMSCNNFVAKHAHKFNKAAIMIDRKKEFKKTGKYLDSGVLLYRS